jgi:hypothetical protein
MRVAILLAACSAHAFSATGGSKCAPGDNPDDCDGLMGISQETGNVLPWGDGSTLCNWKDANNGTAIGCVAGRVSRVYLTANRLEATLESLMPHLSKLTELTELHLDVNSLSGSMPSTISGLTKLTGLWLGANKLTGPIPPEVGDLTSLTGLYLYSNRGITGSIPSTLGKLASLDGLGLESLSLTGSIPSEVGTLTKLTNLGLADNKLTGVVPESICSLKLTTCALDANVFECPLPSCAAKECNAVCK